MTLVFGTLMIAASVIGCGKTGYKLNSKELTNSKTAISESTVENNIDNYKDSIQNAQNFAFELFKQSTSEHKTTAISPVAVMNTLGLTANAVSGDELSQIQKALGQDDIDKFNDLCNYFMNKSGSDSDTSKGILANSLWIKDGIAKDVKDEFIKKASKNMAHRYTAQHLTAQLLMTSINGRLK